MNEKAICKHDHPQPSTCKWCNMAINKDRRYAAAWWGLPLIEEPSFVVSVTTAEQVFPQPKPGLLRKALNFGQALLSHLATGSKHVTQEQQEARLAICRSCVGKGGYYDEAKDTCQHPKCGCLMKRKSSWKGSKCPIKKW